AREILPDFQPAKAGVRLDPKKPTGVGDSAKDSAQSAKRQRSTDGGAPLAKRKKVQSNRSFAEVTKGRTIIGVVDNGSEDGLIPKELWRRVVNELHGRSRAEDLHRTAKTQGAVALRRQVVLTINEETARILEGAGSRIKYGYEHVAVRVYKSDAKSKPGGIDLEIDAQELDLGEPTEDVRPEGMSDVEEKILEGYTSEESDLARALGGVGMEEDSLLGSDTEAEVTVVENLKDVPDIPADKSPSQ
ncbi:hypothetical protein KR067_000225, partial [Drosophila pandora]